MGLMKERKLDIEHRHHHAKHAWMQAETSCQRALTIFEQQRGSTHPESMHARRKYISLLRQRNQATEAEVM